MKKKKRTVCAHLITNGIKQPIVLFSLTWTSYFCTYFVCMYDVTATKSSQYQEKQYYAIEISLVLQNIEIYIGKYIMHQYNSFEYVLN